MFCPKCGSQNDEGVKFCSKCGASMTDGKTATQKTETKKKEGLGTASLVLGIIALVFSFSCIIFVPIFVVLPLAIIGLILGIVNKAKKGKKVAGIILNSFALVISIIMCFIFFAIVGATIDEASTEGSDLNRFLNQLYNEIDRESSDNYVAGKYNCKSFSGSGESSEYIVRFELNKDLTFLWGKYGDTSRNYVNGTYTFTDLEKTNASREYKYYNVKLDGAEYYENGVKQDQEYGSEYEFGITAVNTKKQGIIMNTKTYNMYYCYEE